MAAKTVATEYDSVELRGGRLHKIRRAEARTLGAEDRMAPVAKCYCRSHDVLTAAEAELQRRPTLVPGRVFQRTGEPDWTGSRGPDLCRQPGTPGEVLPELERACRIPVG